MQPRSRNLVGSLVAILAALWTSAWAQAPRDSRPIKVGFGKGAYPFGSVAVPGSTCGFPDYTPEARAASVEGSVVLEVVVLEDGTLGESRVIKSLDVTHGLDAQALAAAHKCRFKPGERERGSPVASVMPLTFVFRLHPPGRIPGELSGQSDEDARFAQDAYSLKAPGVVPPTTIIQPEPKYTSAAMRARIQGTVVLDVVVGADGRVRATRVLTSLDSRNGLDKEAMAAVRAWLFRPATLDGSPVPVVVNVDLLFRLY